MCGRKQNAAINRLKRSKVHKGRLFQVPADGDRLVGTQDNQRTNLFVGGSMEIISRGSLQVLV